MFYIFYCEVFILYVCNKLLVDHRRLVSHLFHLSTIFFVRFSTHLIDHVYATILCLCSANKSLIWRLGPKSSSLPEQKPMNAFLYHVSKFIEINVLFGEFTDGIVRIFCNLIKFQS